MSSHELRLTQSARRDIREILQITQSSWGERQQIEYARQLGKALAELKSYPHVGIARNGIRDGLRTFSVGQHLLLYRVEENTIEVMRIVHQRMNLSGDLIDS